MEIDENEVKCVPCEKDPNIPCHFCLIGMGKQCEKCLEDCSGMEWRQHWHEFRKTGHMKPFFVGKTKLDKSVEQRAEFRLEYYKKHGKFPSIMEVKKHMSELK